MESVHAPMVPYGIHTKSVHVPIYGIYTKPVMNPCGIHTEVVQNKYKLHKNVFKWGGGVRGFKTPMKFLDFILKSEGKEVERKREKKNKKRLGGGGVNST